MQKIKTIIILSFIILILPFVGAPYSFKQVIFFLLGISTFSVAMILKNELSSEKKVLEQTKEEEKTFVDSKNFINVEDSSREETSQGAVFEERFEEKNESSLQFLIDEENIPSNGTEEDIIDFDAKEDEDEQ